MIKPSRLMSLYDMMRFSPAVFLVVGHVSGSADAIVDQLAILERVGRKNSPGVKSLSMRTFSAGAEDGMSALHLECEALGLDAAAVSAARVRDAIHDGKPIAGISVLLNELTGLLRDQLVTRHCWMIETENVRLLLDAGFWGVDVLDKFPSAILDMEEAGKCLAFDRNTACVFHCMRVMEVGLKTLASALGIPYAPSWESYLTQIS